MFFLKNWITHAKIGSVLCLYLKKIGPYEVCFFVNVGPFAVTARLHLQYLLQGLPLLHILDQLLGSLESVHIVHSHAVTFFQATCPGNISQHEEYLSCSWPNFKKTFWTQIFGSLIFWTIIIFYLNFVWPKYFLTNFFLTSQNIVGQFFLSNNSLDNFFGLDIFSTRKFLNQFFAKLSPSSS